MSQTSGADGTHPLELLAGIAFGLALLVAGGAWLVASLAATVFTGSWPDLRLADGLPAVAHLHDHLADPGAAWPNAADRLPGPFAIYLTALLLLGCVAALGRFAFSLRGGVRRVAAARWARGRDLRRLSTKTAQPGRLTLGRTGRHLVCCEPLHSALVIGPTQTGKTTGLAIPAILEWRGPVLATSVKSDLLRDTLSARAERGDVWLFDPLGSTGHPSSSWTPLADCGTWGGSRRIASWLTEGATAGRKGMSEGDFWYASAAKLLAPLLFAAATSGRTMADVVTWVDTQEMAVVEDALRATRDRAAINAFEASAGRDLRQRSSVYWTAETVLEAYADPEVLAHSRTATIRASKLLDGGSHTLFLSATAREQRRLRPLFVALIESVIEEAYRKASETGRPLDPPLLVVLDEAANIAPLPDLDVIASTGASHGVQLLTVLQDLAQAHERWGRDRADTIVNNHRARVIAGGAADERTLEYVNRLLGETEIRQQSSTTGEPGRHSTTTSSGYRPIAPAHVVREAPTGTALLLYGNLPPAWIKFRPWYRDRTLSALVSGAERSSL